MHSRKVLNFASASIAAATFAAPALAQPTIPWSTIDSGGGQLTGAPFTLSATIAQPVAGTPLTGGTFTLTGGFWPGAGPACRPDFNGVSGVSVQDIFDFLAAWFAGAPQADFNGAGGVSVQDIFDFLAAWFAGC